MTDKRNYNAIDLFRIIAAVLVVTIHVEPFGDAVEGSVGECLNFWIQNYLARIAVPFFFVNSGFLLYGKRPLSSFDLSYTKRYIKKIFWLYVIWTVIYLPLSVYDFFKDKNGILHAVILFLRNIIFAGSYTHLWYLPALIFAVALVSVLLYRKIKPVTILAISFVFYFVGLFAQSWFGFLIPLKSASPGLWNLLLMIGKIIVTTRDGLFEAFFFVSLGMCFAFYDIHIRKSKAVTGFLLSMTALFLEVFLLQRFGSMKHHNTYLLLIPAEFFLFCIIIGSKLPDKPIYAKLRIMSSLIFFSHMWISKLVSVLLRMINQPLAYTYLRFLLTLVVSFGFSIAVITLSKYKRLMFLRKLYS